MRPLDHLDVVCRRHKLKLGLVLFAGPGSRALDEPIHPHGELAIRLVYHGEEFGVGARQTADRESVDELAERCLRTLARRGYR